MKFILIIFTTAQLLISCYSKKNALVEKKIEYKQHILGSVLRINDSNKIKIMFVPINSSIGVLDSIRSELIHSEEKGKLVYYNKLFEFYDFNKVYSKNILDTNTLKWCNYIQLNDSIAPIEIIENILKDEILIYSDEICIETPNIIWYCINGYFPINSTYEGPIIFVNYRKEIGLTSYRFRLK